MSNSLLQEYKKFKSSENLYFDSQDDSVLVDIVSCLREKNTFRLFELVLSSVDNGFFELPHPDFPGIITRARLTITLNNFLNLIVFSDENDKSVWVLHQSNNFIEFMVTEKACYSVFRQGLKVQPKAIFVKALEGLESSKYRPFESSFFDGFLLSHYRPFHYFYDRLLNAYIVKDIFSGREDISLVFYRRFNYFSLCDLDFLKGVDVKEVDDAADSVLVSLCSIKYNWISSLQDHKENIRSFEDSLVSSLVGKGEGVEQTFEVGVGGSKVITIWVGITGQKRAWVEQVEGYSKILKKLATEYDQVNVYLDGFTAPYGKTISVPDDEEVVGDICDLLLTEKNIGVKSLVGHDYVAKIKACLECDVFISNAGTGSMVPLRFCRKPGVLHSNSTLYSFPDDYPDSVRVINTEPYVKDIVDEAHGKTTDSTSYSIDWVVVYNELQVALNSIGTLSRESD